MAKDAKGHGSEKRGGGDYAKSASGKPGYNPKVQGGGRMFGRQPTAAEAAANSANVKAFSAFTQGLQPMTPEQQKTLLGRNNPLIDNLTRMKDVMQGTGAHSQGVQQVGQPPSANLKALNKTYDRNENNNFHSENIALLAKNFGTPAEHAQAKEIIAARNKQGYLTSSTKSVPNVHDWQYSIHQKYIGKLTGSKS